MSNDKRPADIWASILAKHDEANFLQTPAWAEMNRLLGNKVIVEPILEQGIAVMTVKNAKRGRYLEIPGGPVIDWDDEKMVQAAISRIREVAKKHHCSFVRIRPQLLSTAQNLQKLQKLGFKVAKMHLAAEHTVLIDLQKSEDELLGAMRRQTRYEVRRAEKLGIKVKKFNSKAVFEEFYQVQQETALRQHFIPPNLNTLLAEREAFQDNARIYIAYTAEHQPIAYGLILNDKNEADYFEAASTELNHKLPGAYALIWQVMKDMKKQNVKRLNLWGIAPKNQPNHRYAGVTTFKTGFGGEVVEYVPAHDLIINHVAYLPNLVVETIRKKKRHL